MHKILRHKAGFHFKCLVNIQFFTDFVKGFLASNERFNIGIRSAYLCVLLSSAGFSAFEDTIPGVRAASMAGSGVGRPLAAESIFINPAAMLDGSTIDVVIFYTRPYELTDLALGSAAGCCRRGALAVGGAVQHFGNTLYNETQYHFSAAWQLFDRLAVGTNVRYSVLAIKSYGRASSVLFDLGALARLSPRVQWGIVVKNANNARLGRAREPLPHIMCSGISVAAVDDFRINVDLYKDVRFPLDVRAGLAYSLFSVLELRLGVGSAPSRMSGGFSIFLKFCRLDYSYDSHIDLGATHAFSIGFCR